MVSSVNIMIPKTTSKKPKGEAKSIGTKDRKSQTQDMAMVEVPVKREGPKQEKKKITSVRRKEPKKSVRRKKTSSEGVANHEVNTPSIRTKKVASPAPSDEKIIEKKKDEGSKQEKIVAKAPTTSKKFNMELAQKFFKQMMESQKITKRAKNNTTEEDVNADTMPESSFNGLSRRSKKVHRNKGKPAPLDRNIFKENGDPIWVVSERKPGDKQVFNEAGELVKNPELMAALEDENLEYEDGKGWINKITSFLGGEMMDWKTYNKEDTLDMDPFAPVNVLKTRGETFFKKEAVIYNTSDAILHLSHNAMERFSNQGEDTCPRRNGPASRENEEEEKTCIITSMKFNMGNLFLINYDRRRPIVSIRKFKKRRQSRKLKCSYLDNVVEGNEKNNQLMNTHFLYK
ncbi:hypothetical protein L5515_014880 [Caenorhabditis briggsae]|uniref:Uncharacterized protein n=1 Tax=Caenorhabditis briggsae TaxID=6238 RepID=A0AAE9J988_CAEBR|nr:hypothetical protein L5515_014880 [Caenorhabditis briggsae]